MTQKGITCFSKQNYFCFLDFGVKYDRDYGLDSPIYISVHVTFALICTEKYHKLT